MSVVSAAVVVLGALSLPAVAQARPAAAPIPSAGPVVHAVPADQPPFPYADCISAARKKGESASYAKWHCDELVKKGWVKPPKR
ncbi:hypothetical protein J7W19_31730 [Streptomyces mobaraensis NBRC 13819 = DSM 40847]|uniref:Uncharacterized protein n=2 Tax=Streptomyces mobaraensis TaxID=35621 RepID=A0A5N5W435_STRMB|nr:hypothetical protein [Streptomyces mobaraensis]KAB7839570.1 hypothetical protein FRZ00_21830 [Streptomyces mobaraensis]QTT77351.1 hypothetical protein J7W19_31730 [Streptomyces mobaraensis NBRC 13819 = DSM 40847]